VEGDEARRKYSQGPKGGPTFKKAWEKAEELTFALDRDLEERILDSGC
jgi:hypothetical protein